MIPIRDTIPSRNYPFVNNCLIGINVILYFVQLSQGPEMGRFIYFYGLVPARYTLDHIASYFSTGQQLLSFFSFMFLHGGFFHLLGNMWTLYIFGDNVEDHLGPLRYLLFYLLCGLISGFSHFFFNMNSNVPIIGASGAIAGVMGAYLVLYPKSKILTLIPIIIIPYFIEIPAYFFLGIWFFLQFLNATASHGGVSGIAWWAHIGGFICGVLLLKIFTLLPETGISHKIRPVTTKKKTNRLQIVRPVNTGNDFHLYGTLKITPHEALMGTKKLVNIPWGFHKRLIKVHIPAQIEQGKILRLKGLGKLSTENSHGDLLLKVNIQS